MSGSPIIAICCSFHCSTFVSLDLSVSGDAGRLVERNTSSTANAPSDPQPLDRGRFWCGLIAGSDAQCHACAGRPRRTLIWSIPKIPCPGQPYFGCNAGANQILRSRAHAHDVNIRASERASMLGFLIITGSSRKARWRGRCLLGTQFHACNRRQIGTPVPDHTRPHPLIARDR